MNGGGYGESVIILVETVRQEFFCVTPRPFDCLNSKTKTSRKCFKCGHNI